MRVRGGHSLEDLAFCQLNKPREKRMQPKPRVTADTETFTVCMGDSPGAEKKKKERKEKKLTTTNLMTHS
jgi:hypothetical protein